MPKPYNHPVRTAESAAVLDLLSGGRVDLGTGRSATRAELEGFGIDPAESRPCGRRPSSHVVGCWTNDEYEFAGEYWQMPDAACSPSRCRSHTRRCGAPRRATRATRRWATLGLGLCSFAVGLPPAEVERKIDIYREAVGGCTKPLGASVHNQAATFTMAICAPDRDKAIAEARESFEWYPKTGARQIATLTDWMAERNESLGTYAYAADMKKTDDSGMLDLLSLEYLDGLQRLRARHARPSAWRPARRTRRRASTCCSAWSTRTRSRTSRSCRPSS